MPIRIGQRLVSLSAIRVQRCATAFTLVSCRLWIEFARGFQTTAVEVAALYTSAPRLARLPVLRRAYVPKTLWRWRLRSCHSKPGGSERLYAFSHCSRRSFTAAGKATFLSPLLPHSKLTKPW